MRGLARARSVSDVILNVVYLSELLNEEVEKERKEGVCYLVTWLPFFCWFLLRLGILIISFIFVIIIEEKFLMINFILKSLIIYQTCILSYVLFYK